MDVSTKGGEVAIDLENAETLPFTETYSEGAIVTIEAIPSFGYVFDGWKGHIASFENPEFIIMDCNKQITASFSIDWRLIGTLSGSLILIILFAVILFLRRNGSETVPMEKLNEELTGEKDIAENGDSQD